MRGCNPQEVPSVINVAGRQNVTRKGINAEPFLRSKIQQGRAEKALARKTISVAKPEFSKMEVDFPEPKRLRQGIHSAAPLARTFCRELPSQNQIRRDHTGLQAQPASPLHSSLPDWLPCQDPTRAHQSIICNSCTVLYLTFRRIVCGNNPCLAGVGSGLVFFLVFCGGTLVTTATCRESARMCCTSNTLLM